jgi:hypothetical protein
MREITLLIICLLIFSCRRDMKEIAINKFKITRSEVGLFHLDNSFLLDSTIKLRAGDSENWKFLGYSNFISHNKLKNHESPSSFYISDFYSNIKKSKFKIYYFQNLKGDVNLIAEEDRFYKKINDTIEIYINANYNFSKKEFFYSVDSLPTQKLIIKNKKKLERILRKGKEINAELCGTSANEILERGFPNKFSPLTENEFNNYKKDFNQ